MLLPPVWQLTDIAPVIIGPAENDIIRDSQAPVVQSEDLRIGDQHLGHHSRTGPGLTLLSDWKEAPKVDVFLEGKLPSGSVRNPDLHFDAEKVVFAFCDHTRSGQKRFFLYEAALDGSFVRQITGTSRDPFKTWGNRVTAFIEDNDPAYLPDGDIIFISTRGQSYGRCHGDGLLSR